MDGGQGVGASVWTMHHLAARSSTRQWEEYLSRYVRDTVDYEGLTGPDGEEKIWVALKGRVCKIQFSD